MLTFFKLLIGASLLLASEINSICYADPDFQGTSKPIPTKLQKMMSRDTWHKGCPVPLKDLSYLHVSYWGFDDKAHLGEIIIHKSLAPELITIFKKLYEVHFPIEKMIIPERLLGSRKFANSFEMGSFLDNVNDTCAFFCKITGSDPHKFSTHSYGIAIDINPRYNPGMIPQEYMHLLEGTQFFNRNIQHKGMIKAGDITVNTFLNHGWIWRGFKTQGVDYMHFEKLISTHYQVNHLEIIPVKKQIPNLKQTID